MFSAFFDFVGIKQHENVQSAEQFLDTYQGCTFLNGMYRMFRKQDVQRWNGIVGRAFPPTMNRVSVFGYDWQGRIFALYNDPDTGAETVLIFEPGTGEAFDTDVDIADFHNIVMPQKHDFVLLSDYFDEWKEFNSCEIQHSQCVGYIIPLFLNGRDDVKNLEISDMEVYWEIMMPLINM